MADSFEEKRALLSQKIAAEREKIQQRSRARMFEIKEIADRRDEHAHQNQLIRAQTQVDTARARTEGSVETMRLQYEQAPGFSDIEFEDFLRRENIRLQGYSTELGMRNKFANQEHQRLLDLALDATISQIVTLSFQASLDQKEINLRHKHEVELRYIDHYNKIDLEKAFKKIARESQGLSDEAAVKLGRKIADEMDADPKPDD